MEGMGWISTIIVGGIAGWLASKFMDARYGIIMNIILGIIGSLLANSILAQFHVVLAGGWLGYLVTGFIGAVVLIFVARLVKR